MRISTSNKRRKRNMIRRILYDIEWKQAIRFAESLVKVFIEERGEEAKLVTDKRRGQIDVYHKPKPIAEKLKANLYRMQLTVNLLTGEVDQKYLHDGGEPTCGVQ